MRSSSRSSSFLQVSARELVHALSLVDNAEATLVVLADRAQRDRRIVRKKIRPLGR